MTLQESSPPKPMTTTTTSTVEMAVCCGCRPQRRRYKKKHRKNLFQRRPRFLFFRRKKGYFDADMGQESEWQALERNIEYSQRDDDSQYFFDAVDTPLEDDEFPIDGYVIKSGGELGDYPIIFTTSLQHPAPHFTNDDPHTWLRKSLQVKTGGGAEEDEQQLAGAESLDEVHELHPQHKKSQQTQQKRRDSHLSVMSRDTIQSHKTPSQRFQKIKKRSTLEHKTQLEQPRVKSHGLQGYPGALTVDEMEECQKFIRGLAQLPSEVSEQVYSFRDVEEEPYTICRWLRATKFDADSILQRLEENQPMFDNAKMEEFFPDVGDALGCPLSVFLSQYPFLPVGRGKNGCPVNYFLAGKINPEGILCLTTIKKLESYFWYSFMWKFKNEVRAAQDRDPDFVRLEGINIIELDGLSSSALSSETMDVIKLASKISDFFPETLHCMLVLNAPGFFALAWGVIKKFIDARTAARIQLFANKEKGQQALQKLIDKAQLPADYDGTNISIREAFLKEASDASLIRQEIELLYCKRKGRAHTKSWSLDKTETIRITVYTRSVSTGHVSIHLNGQTFRSFDAKCCIAGENGDEDNECSLNDATDAGTPLPNQVATKTLAGPGKVTVEIHDLDDMEKRHSGKSRGYFLVVGDVKKAADVTPKIKLQQQQKMAVSMAGLSGSPSSGKHMQGSDGLDGPSKKAKTSK